MLTPQKSKLGDSTPSPVASTSDISAARGRLKRFMLANAFGKGKVKKGPILGGEDKRFKGYVKAAWPSLLVFWLVNAGGEAAAFIQPVTDELNSNPDRCAELNVIGIFKMNSGGGGNNGYGNNQNSSWGNSSNLIRISRIADGKATTIRIPTETPIQEGIIRTQDGEPTTTVGET